MRYHFYNYAIAYLPTSLSKIREITFCNFPDCHFASFSDYITSASHYESVGHFSGGWFNL